VIEYRRNPKLTNDALNALFAAAWEAHTVSDFSNTLEHSLGFVGAFELERLVGFVNLAWDGGAHAFVLDTTVHPEFRRRGIGSGLVTRAIELARERGCDWVHVDFEPHLEKFYSDCGFKPTLAGLVKLA
jgi:GNAT superfamily N-acetyltransferase